jgi:dienelactone hydrolase
MEKSHLLGWIRPTFLKFIFMMQGGVEQSKSLISMTSSLRVFHSKLPKFSNSKLAMEGPLVDGISNHRSFKVNPQRGTRAFLKSKVAVNPKAFNSCTNFNFSLHEAMEYWSAISGEPREQSANPPIDSSALNDLFDALEFAIKRGWVDEARVGITGNSNGGWLSLRAVQTSEKFAAVVAVGAPVNYHSLYGTTDSQKRLVPDSFAHYPWDNPNDYLDISPISFVRRIKVPLLIIHSENDFRVNICQAEELFSAMKILGREVAFARIPNEYHYPRFYKMPKHKVQKLELTIQWFDTHINKDR